MQNQKGISTLIGIIIVVAVAIVAFGGVFAYQYFTAKTQPVVQTQTKTVGWKTYTNTEYGFEFQYPNDWIKVNGPDGLIEFNSPQQTIFPSLTIDLYENNCSVSLYDFLAEDPTFEDMHNKTSLNLIKKIVLNNGTSGYKTTYNFIDKVDSSNNSLLTSYSFKNDKNCAIVSISLGSNKDSEIYSKIISTFKFTK